MAGEEYQSAYTGKEIDERLGKVPGLETSVSQLSAEKVSKTALTLGYGTDGKLYVFVNGAPTGNGIDIAVRGDATCVIDENNNLIISGAPDGNYTMKYQYEDGTFSDSISVVVGDVPEPEVIVNLIPTLTDVDLSTIYNGIGYKENTRVSVSAVSASNPTGEKTATGATLTGLCPIGEDGDVFHFRGIEGISGTSEYSKAYWCYDASGTLLNTGVLAIPDSAIGTDENGDYTVTMKRSAWTNLISGTVYIRFNVGAVTGEFIMTRNQLIPLA